MSAPKDFSALLVASSTKRRDTGAASTVHLALNEALGLTRRHAGVSAGRYFGAQWTKNRFPTPYLRNTLWGGGYGPPLEGEVMRAPLTVSRIGAAR